MPPAAGSVGLALGTCKSPSPKSHASPAGVSRAKPLGFQLLTRASKRGNNKRKSTLRPPAAASPHLPFFCSERAGKARSIPRHAPAAAHRCRRNQDMGAAEGPGCCCAGLSAAGCMRPPQIPPNLGQRVPRTPAPTQRGWHGGVPEPASPQQAAATGPRESDLPFLGATGLQPQRDVAKRRGRKKNQIIGRKQRWLPHPGTGRARGGGRRTPARWHDTTAPSGADCHLTLGLGAS